MTTNEVVLFAILVLALFIALGCGNQALQVNAEIARAMLEVQSTNGPMIREARVNASVTAARAVHERGGTESEAQAIATDTASHWQCALDGHGIYATAVSAYIDTITLWQTGQDFEIEDILPFVRRAIDAYTFLASCMTSLSSDLFSEEPSFFSLIPSAWSMTE